MGQLYLALHLCDLAVFLVDLRPKATTTASRKESNMFLTSSAVMASASAPRKAGSVRDDLMRPNFEPGCGRTAELQNGQELPLSMLTPGMGPYDAGKGQAFKTHLQVTERCSETPRNSVLAEA